MPESNEGSELVSEAVGEIKFVGIDVVSMQVNGRTVATMSVGGSEINRDVLTKQTQIALIDNGIRHEKADRNHKKFSGVLGNGTATLVAAGATGGLGFEVYQSNSNWLKVAYGAGAIVTGLMTLGA